MSTTSDEYDYIVVGGGTAGLVVASRLSEDPNLHILIIEAGEDHMSDPRVSMPAGWSTLLGSDCDWNFSTAPQDHLSGRIIGHPQGRVLGGSSAINTQAFIPPSKVGINAWATLGNPGWDWESMRPYYRKSYTLAMPPEAIRDHLGLAYIDEDIRGTSGPIQASFSSTIRDLLPNVWYRTFQKLDLNTKSDPFSGQVVGGYNSPSTIHPTTKERSYSAVAYYKPASNRSNLTLLTGGLVEKILLRAQEPAEAVAATGVCFTRAGESHTVRARKEVILAAGAFQSPKLLELSGIGAANILRNYDVPVAIDSPGVGENLQDHLMVGMSFEVKDGVETLDDLARQDPRASEAALNSYLADKTGPLGVASVNSFGVLPVMKFLTADGHSQRKRLFERYSAEAMNTFNYDFIRSIIDSVDESSAAFFAYPAQGNFEVGGGANPRDVTKASLQGDFITITVCLLHPFSRGSVHITSADPKLRPLIDPQYLAKDLDVEIFALHLQYLQTLVQTEPLATMLKPNGRRSSPELDLDDLEAVKEHIRKTAISNWHPVGTCAMLPRDKGGVINERLIVHGTKNLRVVDSSTFPIITRGNPLTSVYAVAEKAADLIKAKNESA